MSRDFQIYGETLVKVTGGRNSSIPVVTELGLSSGPIEVHPNFSYEPALTDDFGDKTGPDWMVFPSWVDITMQLVHYDESILQACWTESLASPSPRGSLAGAGTLLGGAGNGGAGAVGDDSHYITVELISATTGSVWNFSQCYLTGEIAYPLGTERSVVTLTWRSIPYASPDSNNEWISKGTIIYSNP